MHFHIWYHDWRQPKHNFLLMKNPQWSRKTENGGNISSATESKRIATYIWKPIILKNTCIHYCTEININLLQNTCNFHRKFRFTFSLILSENASNVYFREAKFQNLPGEHTPDPRTFALHSILANQFWPASAGPDPGFFLFTCEEDVIL